uniref:POX domain-containing protein n=1 Tax=Nelumbo nucifera TaxID=4432 RepID=A0A822Y1R6_NELNU|nr:TPA_asm: hypothetical protein HUJ06_028028 [Nelumbo nucifera]
MAEGFEPFHVPQQSRRDKLRVVGQNHPTCEEAAATSLQGCAGLLPLYDPSLLTSEMLTCANAGTSEFHHQNHPPLGGAGEGCKQNPACVVKEEGGNLMGYVGGFMNASSSSSSHHPYLDPQSSLALNPSSIQDINSNPFLYTTHNLRDFDHSFHSGEVVTFKPEPLSLTPDSTTTGQGLSLSLSTHNTRQQNLPLELNLQRYESAMFGDKGIGGFVVRGIGAGTGGASTSNDILRCSAPLGPFTGYASILKGSRFLKPAQLLLEEFCGVGRGIYAERSCGDSSLMDSTMENLSAAGISVDDPLGCGDRSEHRRKKTRLISMLDEVSNWFINARVRLWKPMVEEIHMLETRQAQKASETEDRNTEKLVDHPPPENSLATDKQPQNSSVQKTQDPPLKRTRNDLPHVLNRSDVPMNFSYHNIPNQVGVSMSTVGINSGVSLTLGLQQNNGIGLSEPFTMNIAHRFGLEANNEGYVMGGFEAQNRQFGKDIGGQLLHDFVG